MHRRPRLCCLLLASAATAQTWQELPAAVPTTAVVWDAARHRLLLAGTDSQQRLYEWDGSAARERLGELAGQRTVSRLLYDAANQQVLALSTDFWVGTWSGGGWTWLTGGTPPPSGVSLSAAFDPLRRRLVVVTGNVHEWDGQRWWSLGGNGAIAGAAFAFDPVTQRCLLYNSPIAQTAHTEVWDGFAWTTANRNSAPGPRTQPGVALDPVSQRLVLYGGHPTATDTWTWNGTHWQLLPTTNHPGPQLQPHLVADDAGLVLVSTQGPDPGAVWRLRGNTWSLASRLALSPQTGGNTGYTYDPVRGTVVAFGGSLTSTAPAAQTHVFDRHWLPVRPTHNPPLRLNSMLAWSGQGQRVLLFGGLAQSVLGDTWTWNGSDWEPRQPAHTPSARYGAVFLEDPAGGVLLFGGTDSTNYFGDQWHWDGTDWQQQSPSVLPAARAFATAAFDPDRGQVVALGGYASTAAYALETWVWNGSHWSAAPPMASLPQVGTASFRPSSRRILALGTSNAFEWTGTQWIALAGLGHGSVYAPSPRLATHHGRGQLLLFSPPAVRLLSGQRARATTFGANCASGPAPNLAALDVPAPDTAFAIELTARAPSAPTFLVVGLAAQNVALGSGCRSLVALQLAVNFALADAAGIARFPIPIPNTPALRGVQFCNQGAVWDPAQSPLGTVTLTAGLQVTIGD